MKRFIFLFVALLCCVSATAQVVFVATLQHEGTTTQYYGQDALNSAYNAAVDGDVITLSDGTFTWNAGNFNKSITLRGAGINGKNRTIVSGSDFKVATRNKDLTTHIEGIRFQTTIYIYNEDAQYEKGKIEFVKCVCQSVYTSYSGTPNTDSPKVNFYNCILGDMNFTQKQCYPKYNVVNCYIINLYGGSNESASVGNNTSVFDHCVIEIKNTFYAPYRYYYLNFLNSIFVWSWGNYSGGDTNYILPNTATATNCLSVKKSTLFNSLIVNKGNMTAGTCAEVFKTFKGGGYNDIETFELTDEAKAAYIGADGTEVGMQGGMMPFNTTVQYPIITTFNADVRTDKEGKLNVEIAVDGK